MNCSRSSLVLNCRNAVRSSGAMMYTTSSFSHCLYWASNSFNALPIFFFCSLVSFCGEVDVAGFVEGTSCCATTGASEIIMENTDTKRERTALAIWTPQPLKPKDSNARTSSRQTRFRFFYLYAPGKTCPISRVLRHLPSRFSLDSTFQCLVALASDTCPSVQVLPVFFEKRVVTSVPRQAPIANSACCSLLS